MREAAMEDEALYVMKHDGLARHLGMRVEKATPGFARVSMPLTGNHKNGMGAAHGGAIFALADVAFGAASNAGRRTGVVNMATSMEYLLPGLVGPLVAEARLVRLGGHIVSYDTRIFDGKGALIARAMTSGYITGLVLPERDASAG